MVLGERFVRRLAGLGAALGLDSCIALAPGARLQREQDGSGTRLRITGGAEGRAGLHLPQWAFTALSQARPGRPLSAYLPQCLSGTGTGADAALAFLTALHARCLLVVTRAHAVAGRPAAPADGAAPGPHPPVRPGEGGTP
jgi:hypothetical protein